MYLSKPVRRQLIVVALIVLGAVAGVAFTYAFGGKVIQYGLSSTVGDQLDIESQAIDIAVRDPRVKALIEGKECKILATTKMWLKVTGENQTSGGEGYPIKITVIGPGGGESTLFIERVKPIVVITILYPDGSGYWVEIDVTAGTVGEPKYIPNILSSTK
ncbi:hypothetical protein MUO93_12090 [Candidatus Bathyarchaeota archaeon]|nr:hypothetical protein [Candidatus Bathyarchaeota archaeon]